MNFKKPRDESKPLFKASKILPLDLNTHFNSAKFLWKVYNSFTCPSLTSLFTKRDQGVSYHVPHKRLDVSQNSISYAGVKTWNKIPLHIRACTSLDSFKKIYKEHLINNISSSS